MHLKSFEIFNKKKTKMKTVIEINKNATKT